MKLFEPYTINKTTIKNRIIMPGMKFRSLTEAVTKDLEES